jgi:CRP/FNR family cyclic AMP-dependent transcriptional regulator
MLAHPFFGAGSTRDAVNRHENRQFSRYRDPRAVVAHLDQTDEAFFIISGGMRVTIHSLAGKAVSFRELGPGEVFGEYPAIDRGPRSASVEAHTACLVATLDGSRGDPRVEASNHCVTR